MLWKIAVPPSLAFPMTLPPLPLMPSLTGGTRKVPLAIPVPASCSFWLIPAAATVAAVMPGKPNSSPNWPTPYALAVTVAHYPTGASKRNPIEHRLFSEVSRNWADEPLDSHQKIPQLFSHHANPNRTSGHCLFSTADSILAVSNPHPINWLHLDCSATKLSPSGTTLSSLNCELVLA